MNGYRLTVKGYSKGLNLVLSGVHYDYRTKRVFNPVKAENDKICIWAIRQSIALRNAKIDKPIVIHYKFFWANKRSDRMNIAEAFDKSFQDALQKVGVIKNDGWDDVINATFDFDIDKINPRVEVLIEELGCTTYEIFDWDSVLKREQERRK